MTRFHRLFPVLSILLAAAAVGPWAQASEAPQPSVPETVEPGRTAGAEPAGPSPSPAAEPPAAAPDGTPPAEPELAEARSSRLQGMAYLDRRRRVVGAAVLVVPEEQPARVWLTATDGKGRFRLSEVPDGSYRVEIRRDGLAPVTKNNVSLRFPFRAVVEVEMGAGAPAASGAAAPRVGSGGGDTALRGRVVDEDGNPLSEVPVRLVRADAKADPRTVTTDTQGRFAARDLMPGPWRVSVLGLGYLPIRAELDLGGDVMLQSVLIRQPADYEPAPIDLLPAERPIPPEALKRAPQRAPAREAEAEPSDPDASGDDA